MRKHKRKTSWREYSKIILLAMIFMWFIVAVFGIVVTGYQLIISPESVSMDGLFNYIGLPMTGGIVTYLIKSAIENKQKIKNSAVENDFNDENGEEVMNDE